MMNARMIHAGDLQVFFSEYIGKGPFFEPLRDKAFFKKATMKGV